MIRYRFKTNAAYDPRPLIDMAPIKMPWWCTGFNEYAIIVCYLPEGEPLTKYWDDAFDIEAEIVGEIKYSDRFPKPEWCILDGGVGMSRQFRLSNDWYGDDGFAIFKKKQIKINPGLTVLVGCNGAGKTTLLKQINQSLKNKDIPVLFHSNMSDGERELRSKAAFWGNFDIVARTMMSSEGENIVNVLEDIARKMGRMSQDNPDAKELWFLFDAIDSGLSVDNVIDIKESLIPLVIETEKDKDVYFVISANAYEFARNENCFDVINGKYIKFKDYEEYRDYILKTKEQKLERYGE